MNITIRFRRDYSFNWTKFNPVLAEGEPGYEKDTGRFKIGNGDAQWVDLEYATASDTVMLQALMEHIDAAEPHPVYDDGPSWLLLYLNAKV